MAAGALWSTHRQALKTITGDAGGKAILDAHPDLQHSVKISGDAARFDVDTADDLARAEIAAQKQG